MASLFHHLSRFLKVLTILMELLLITAAFEKPQEKLRVQYKRCTVYLWTIVYGIISPNASIIFFFPVYFYLSEDVLRLH